MRLSPFAVVLALQMGGAVARAAQDSAAVRPGGADAPLDPATLASAYVDAGARELVEGARARRDSVDATIRGYSALVRERVSAGLRALRRDRLLYRREAAARVRWHRYLSSEVEALGAREVIPLISADARVPNDLGDVFPHLVYDPGEDRLLGLGDDDYVRHPLAAGSERDYRYASGDTTAIRLPDGREVRLLELRVLPRRSDSRLLSGVLWLDSESHAVVQAAFRLARPFDLERDVAALDEDDAEEIDEIPGLLKPIRAAVDYIAIEYGLWELRWWLPRLIAFEGQVQVGPLLRFPIRFERAYSEYEVSADTSGLPPVRIALAGDTTRRPCRAAVCRCYRGACRRVHVRVPADTLSLLDSELLPRSVYAEGVALASPDRLREIVALLDGVPSAPAAFEPPRIRWGLDRPGLIRYNRVEGFSLGARLELGYGAWAGDVTGRIGTADRAPRGAVGIERTALGERVRLEAYRRLMAADPSARPFGLGNSLDALVLGRDDGDYYRADGVALEGGREGVAGRLNYEWRVFAERHRPAPANTDFSLRGVLDGDLRFRPDLPADDAELVGARLALRLRRGLDPAGFRWGVNVAVDGATGDFRFVRPMLGAQLAVPLPAGLVGSVEAAAGRAYGRPPAQRLWFLGGAGTLRGYGPLTARGTAYWRGRAELATAFPAARVAVFTDAGQAGAPESLGRGRPLLSAGVGASFLDGLLRVDLARALREYAGWRLHFHVDGSL